jgi:hypothetical protein
VSGTYYAGILRDAAIRLIGISNVKLLDYAEITGRHVSAEERLIIEFTRVSPSHGIYSIEFT